jgi:hypothetical protein
MHPTQNRFAARVALSQDSGGSFGSCSCELSSNESLLAELVAIRLNSCVDESELRHCPTGCDVGEFISRYIPTELRASGDFGAIAQKIDSVLEAVDHHCKDVNEPALTRRQALLIACAAFDQGLAAPTPEALAAGSTAIDQLKSLLASEAAIISQLSGQAENSEHVRRNLLREVFNARHVAASENIELSAANERLHARKIPATSEEIAKLVDAVGPDAYHQSRTFWGEVDKEADYYLKIGRMACRNELTRELHFQAHAEVVFESKYQESMGAGFRGLLSPAHAAAVGLKLSLRACDLESLKNEQGLMPLYLRNLAPESSFDMFVRREALELLAFVGNASEDMHLLERIVEAEEAPLCVRFTAEVTRRKILARGESAE